MVQVTQPLASSSLWSESSRIPFHPGVMSAAQAGHHPVSSFVKLPDWCVSLYFTTSSNASSIFPRSLTNLICCQTFWFKDIQEPAQQVLILGRAVMIWIGLPVNAFQLSHIYLFSLRGFLVPPPKHGGICLSTLLSYGTVASGA